MASSYYDSSDKVVYDGDVAEASDLNAVNTACDTAFQLVETAVSGAGSDAAYYAGVAEDWASEDEDSIVADGKYSSLHYAAKAADSASAASSSASAASSSASAASTSESNAASSESTALQAETDAQTAQGLAETAQAAAEVAQAAAESAESGAQTAQGLAETAQSAAETAETNAELAETNAETAQSAAEAAQTAAETAQTAAELAETNAETAETNAAASALEASGYEADVIAAGAAQVALVEAEGDDQFARISGLDAVLYSELTGSAYMPKGTTAQRDGTPQAGMLRFNTTEEEFEGYNGSEWAAVGGAGLIGEIIMWPLDTPPTGFLICDGGEYAYNTYPELGALLGGSPGGNFNVPDIDLFAKNSKGTDTNTKETADVGTHGHTAVAVADHDHGAVTGSGGSHNHSASSNTTGSHTHSQMGVSSGGWDFSSGSRSFSDDIYTNTGSAGSHKHTITVNSAAAHTHSITAGGGHTPTINNYTGTNQPACTLINFCIRAE